MSSFQVLQSCSGDLCPKPSGYTASWAWGLRKASCRRPGSLYGNPDCPLSNAREGLRICLPQSCSSANGFCPDLSPACTISLRSHFMFSRLHKVLKSILERQSHPYTLGHSVKNIQGVKLSTPTSLSWELLSSWSSYTRKSYGALPHRSKCCTALRENWVPTWEHLDYISSLNARLDVLF